MKKSTKTIIILIVIAMTFSLSSVSIYNSYEAKVNKDYTTIEYNDSVYVNVDSASVDCVFEKQLKAYQCGNSLYSQWLVSPMCYISNDKKYIKIISEDDTIDSKIMYFKIIK